jgi:hypothetical protein
MSTVVAAGMALVIVFAFTLVYLNRASSEVVGAAFPVVFAAISALALVFAFGKPAPIERSFPVLVPFQQADKYPVYVPHRPLQSLTLSMFDKALNSNPKLLEDPRFKDSVGQNPLFHYYLQKAIINWLSMKYWNTWRIRIERFETGGTQETTGPADDFKSYAVKKLSADEVKQLTPTNPFATVAPFGTGTLAIPRYSKVEVQEPHSDKGVGETSEIRIRNWHSDIRINIRYGGSGVGLGGYGSLIGMPQEEAQKHYATFEYIVSFSATFWPYLRGHPEMAAQREWAEGILAGLRTEFDEELIWKRATESYMLWNQLPASAKTSALTIGPVRSAPIKP